MTDAYANDPILSEAAEKWSQFRGTSLMPRDTSALWHALSDQVRGQSIMAAILDDTGNVLTYRSGSRADQLFGQRLAGLKLDEYLKSEFASIVKQLYQDLARSKRPLFITGEYGGKGSGNVILRRLMLPLASERDNVVDGALVTFTWDDAPGNLATIREAAIGSPGQVTAPVATPVQIERRGVEQARLERDADCRPQSDISRLALAAWNEARKGKDQPVARDDLLPFRLKAALPHIALMEHEAASGRFRYRLCGSISVAIANRDVTGRYLDEIYTPELAARYVPILHEMMQSGNPARLCGILAPPGKPIRHIEYVCLPISTDRARIDQIIVVNAYIGETGEAA